MSCMCWGNKEFVQIPWVSFCGVLTVKPWLWPNCIYCSFSTHCKASLQNHLRIWFELSEHCQILTLLDGNPENLLTQSIIRLLRKPIALVFDDLGPRLSRFGNHICNIWILPTPYKNCFVQSSFCTFPRIFSYFYLTAAIIPFILKGLVSICAPSYYLVFTQMHIKQY